MADFSQLDFSSSSDDEIEEWRLYQLVQGRKRKILAIDRIPCRTPALIGNDYTRELLTGHCAQILENFRITVDTFRRLCMPPLVKYNVVESAYKNIPGFMAPFRGVGYHMQDFIGRGRAPRTQEEYFNHIHYSLLRNVIERSFGCLKRRFVFLRGPMNNYSLRHQILFVIACCVLHDFIKDVQLEDDIIREFANEELQVEQESGNEGNDGNQNKLQEIDTYDGAVLQWNNRRITIANEIWNASRSSR